MCGCLLQPLMGDLACNPGMCPDLESNRRPFLLQDKAQPTEPYQSGLGSVVLEILVDFDNWPFGLLVCFLFWHLKFPLLCFKFPNKEEWTHTPQGPQPKTPRKAVPQACEIFLSVTLLCGPRCAVWSPGPVDNERVLFYFPNGYFWKAFLQSQ